MSLARKLTKFSTFSAALGVVLALISTDSKAQTQYNVESLGQKAKSYDLKETYRDEVIKKNLKQNLNFEAGFSIGTPQDSYTRNHFPIQYGGEITGNVKINNKFKVNTFANFSKGNSTPEEEREISSSSLGLGVEYRCRDFIDLGIGVINKTQNISGPPNGFPNNLNKTGFYFQAKKEIPIIPENLSLYFKIRCNQIKEIGNNELSAGLIFKP